MENVTKFLESSTIHGFAYIATGSKNVRLFWILVIMGGFSAAAILIHTAFQSWDESPVKTTIETLPIKKITFPKVTVCPPKNTYTDLNYDLVMTENTTLDNDTRNELTDYAIQLLQDKLYDSIMANLSMLEDEERYYNWYHGYTKIQVCGSGEWARSENDYDINTWATSGSIATQYFRDKFNADNVVGDLMFRVYINPPLSIRTNTNLTLYIEAEKVSMKDLSTGHDDFVLGTSWTAIDADITIMAKNITPPPPQFSVKLGREVSKEEIENVQLSTMPGFSMKWYFSEPVDSVAYYYEDTLFNLVSKIFVKFSNMIKMTDYSNKVIWDILKDVKLKYLREMSFVGRCNPHSYLLIGQYEEIYILKN